MGRQNLTMFSGASSAFWWFLCHFFNLLRSDESMFSGFTVLNRCKHLIFIFPTEREWQPVNCPMQQRSMKLNKGNVLNDCSCNIESLEFQCCLGLKKMKKTKDFSYCFKFLCLFVRNRAILEAKHRSGSLRLWPRTEIKRFLYLQQSILFLCDSMLAVCNIQLYINVGSVLRKQRAEIKKMWLHVGVTPEAKSNKCSTQSCIQQLELWSKCFPNLNSPWKPRWETVLIVRFVREKGNMLHNPRSYSSHQEGKKEMIKKKYIYFFKTLLYMLHNNFAHTPIIPRGGQLPAESEVTDHQTSWDLQIISHTLCKELHWNFRFPSLAVNKSGIGCC